MFVQLDLSRSRRRRRWWLLPLVPAVLWLCLPRLAAALPAAAARADGSSGRGTLRGSMPCSRKILRCISVLQPTQTQLPRMRLCAVSLAAGAPSAASPRRGCWPGRRRPYAGLPGCRPRCRRVGRGRAVRGDRNQLGRSLLHSSLYRSSRAVRQLRWAGRAGKVGADRPARRLHADHRGDRDHPGRGLAGYAGRSPGPRCRRTDGLRPADRYCRPARCRIFCAHRLIFCRNSAIINVFEIHDMR